MPDKNNNTAILVFIRDPKHEAKEKVFAKHIGLRGNEKLAERLNKRIVSLSRKSGIPFFVFDSSKQIGSSFGERLTNAFEAVFAEGFEKVIAVGNDCLSLNKNTLLRAEVDIQKNELVLGPTHDGGFYLIGVSKKSFNPDAFLDFNWTTQELTDDFQTFILNNQLSAAYFETAYDIDNENDLHFTLIHLPRLFSLRKAIEKILSNTAFKIFVYNRLFSNPNLRRFSLLRAPPVL
jgi:uncharacterized protein